MNYPFLYQVVDTLNADSIKKEMQISSETIKVWDDWNLKPVQSSQISDYIAKKFSHLKLFKNQIYLSEGTSSNFHIDRFYIHHLLHRVLIPLDDQFQYEWIVDEKPQIYKPSKGEVILFNNMVPHRFYSELNNNRNVIYFDLFDPKVEPFFSQLKGDYSQENGILQQKYNPK